MLLHSLEILRQLFFVNSGFIPASTSSWFLTWFTQSSTNRDSDQAVFRIWDYFVCSEISSQLFFVASLLDDILPDNEELIENTLTSSACIRQYKLLPKNIDRLVRKAEQMKFTFRRSKKIVNEYNSIFECHGATSRYSLSTRKSFFQSPRFYFWLTIFIFSLLFWTYRTGYLISGSKNFHHMKHQIAKGLSGIHSTVRNQVKTLFKNPNDLQDI